VVTWDYGRSAETNSCEISHNLEGLAACAAVINSGRSAETFFFQSIHSMLRRVMMVIKYRWLPEMILRACTATVWRLNSQHDSR
jgi:hypothetical protein